jgi:DmsE family decaheme c-type cytochrome
MLEADPDRGAAANRFTGSDSCLDCHAGRGRSLEASFHAPLLKGREGSVGCEECHGPGIDHVGTGDERGIRHPEKAPREASNAVCLRCHDAVLTAPVRGHPKWVAERQVACVTCHTVHVDLNLRARAHGRGPFPSAAALENAGATDLEPARCIVCHPDYHPEMAKSGHRDLATEGRACASCHGPGSLHAANGGLRGLILLPTEQEPAEADRSCNACHDAAKKPTIAWTCSEHRAANVSCVACHDPNAPMGKTLRAEDPALCVRCHQDTGAEFRLPSRHHVLEGRMRCNDCHDPHGNEAGFHRFDLTRQVCLKCHPEKGASFVFDHGAKTLEGCVSCHRPHGSPNPRLLETHEIRTQCIACHADMPDTHDQRIGSRFRDCLHCHIEIHGSDTNRHFLR